MWGDGVQAWVSLPLHTNVTWTPTLIMSSNYGNYPAKPSTCDLVNNVPIQSIATFLACDPHWPPWLSPL